MALSPVSMQFATDDVLLAGDAIDFPRPH